MTPKRSLFAVVFVAQACFFMYAGYVSHPTVSPFFAPITVKAPLSEFEQKVEKEMELSDVKGLCRSFAVQSVALKDIDKMLSHNRQAQETQNAAYSSLEKRIQSAIASAITAKDANAPMVDDTAALVAASK